MNANALRRMLERVVFASLYVPGTAACSSAGSAATNATDASSNSEVIVTSCGDKVQVTPGPFGNCYAQCFPLEAGAYDAAVADAGDAGNQIGICTKLCGGSGWFSCEPYQDGGPLVIRCYPNCTGRRPAGLVLPSHGLGASVGAYFAEMARLEAASVVAFRRLRSELVAHGAPRRLIRAVERAARDEVRHARSARALARRFGGSAVPFHVAPQRARSLAAIARENAVEGCVRETFGALIATWQGRTAADRRIRAVFERIARDETRHAALAFRVDAWTSQKLSRRQRVCVLAARRRAEQAVLEEVRRADSSSAAAATLGLPSSAAQRTLAARLFEALS